MTIYEPAAVIAKLLIDLGLATDPDDGAAWPVYIASEPNEPDNVITCYTTTGILHGRNQITGGMFEHYGIQVRVRAEGHEAGEPRFRIIITSLAALVLYRTVMVGSSEFVIHAITEQSFKGHLGNEPDTSRQLFVANFVISLTQVS